MFSTNAAYGRFVGSIVLSLAAIVASESWRGRHKTSIESGVEARPSRSPLLVDGKLEVTPGTIDFGKVDEGARKHCDVLLTNAQANDAIRFISVETSCGCTSARLNTTELLPHETTTMDINVDTSSARPGPFVKTILVRYVVGNAGHDVKSALIAVSGIEQYRIQVEPQELSVLFDEHGSASTQELVVKSEMHSDVVPTNVSVIGSDEEGYGGTANINCGISVHKSSDERSVIELTFGHEPQQLSGDALVKLEFKGLSSMLIPVRWNSVRAVECNPHSLVLSGSESARATFQIRPALVDAALPRFVIQTDFPGVTVKLLEQTGSQQTYGVAIRRAGSPVTSGNINFVSELKAANAESNARVVGCIPVVVMWK